MRVAEDLYFKESDLQLTLLLTWIFENTITGFFCKFISSLNICTHIVSWQVS